MALRPNSLWDGYSSAPYVIGQQLAEDLIFTGKHGLAATDFDSNVAHYQAVGPTYYLLARALWDPGKKYFLYTADEISSACDWSTAAEEISSGCL